MKTLPIITVALAGNPNSGKTSLFNHLAGANQKVGNFSGVTVEKVEGFLTYKGYRIQVTDLPGTYSLTAYSPEEIVARKYIITKKPDVIVNVVDGTNIERNMNLTTQLLELKKNVLIAVNMSDEMDREGIRVNYAHLQTLLGSHIVPTNSRKGQGIKNLLEHIVQVYEGDIIQTKNKIVYQKELEERICELSKMLKKEVSLTKYYRPRWLAVKLFENDEEIYKLVKEKPLWIRAQKLINNANDFLNIHYDEDSEILIAEGRRAFIRGAIKETVSFEGERKKSLTEKIDNILINRITGLPVFLISMWLIFQFVFKVGEYPMLWIETFFNEMGSAVSKFIDHEMIESILVDGVIGGVGGVIVFLPNILLLFLALAFLEGTGYMARAAFVVDKLMHVFGLHGKSAISMITGFGCSVPAFMSTRTLKSNSDRITTLLIIPFMSCGAKLPVYLLIIGAFFSTQAAGNVLFGIYLFGIIIALLSARVFKSTIFKGNSEPFVMELPPYRLPSLKSLFFQMWHKASLYLKKAATLILIASVIIWLGSNFPKSTAIEKEYNQKITKVENTSLSSEIKTKKINILRAEEASLQMKYSVIGRIGVGIEPVLKPLGFDWRIGISLISGIVAKEVVVSTMGTIYSLGEVDSDEPVGLHEKLANEPDYNIATAIALLIFVLLYVPCNAASIVFHREAAKWKYTLVYIGYSMTLAWILSFLGYTVTSWII